MVEDKKLFEGVNRISIGISTFIRVTLNTLTIF